MVIRYSILPTNAWTALIYRVQPARELRFVQPERRSHLTELAKIDYSISARSIEFSTAQLPRQGASNRDGMSCQRAELA